MSTNNLPTYHDQPLKLTNDEIETPIKVVVEFFTSYRLPDIRKSLDSLFQDSLPKDTVTSKEHFNTHSEIVKLIEACWVIKENSGNGTCFALQPDAEDILGKPPLLIEFVKSDPLFVVTEIFKQHTLSKLRELIRDWQFVCISTEVTVYDDASQRKGLLLLINNLYSFVEALFVISSKNIKDTTKSESWVQENKTQKLNKDELSNPRQVLISFYDKFPIVYLRRELYDWFGASLSYAGEWPDNFCETHVLESYRIFSCLFESAKTLTFNSQ